MAKNKFLKSFEKMYEATTDESIKEYNNSSSKTKNLIWITILAVTTIVVITMLFLSISALSATKSLGEGIGNTVGNVVGTTEALLNASKTYEEGKKIGISAEDTTSRINEILETGNLEVYVAGISIKETSKFGDEGLEKYAALYVAKGYAIFSTDLSKAKIDEKDSIIYVELAPIHADVYIDDSATEKIAEYQNKSLSTAIQTTAQDGYDIYINTWNKSRQAIQNSVENYDSLLSSAEEAAIENVTIMFNIITKKEIVVEIAREGE